MQFEKHQSNDWAIIIAALTALSLVLVFAPETITLIVSSVLVIGIAVMKPQISLYYLLVYTAIRPMLVEVNPGFRWAGDLLIAVLLLRLIVENRNNLGKIFKFKAFEWALFIFLAFGSAVALMKGVGIGGIVFQVRTFIIMYLVYVYVSRTKLTKSWLVELSWVAVALGWMLSIQGIIEKLSLRQWLIPYEWSILPLSPHNIVRIYGWAGNPNSLAMILVFTIFAAFFLLYQFDWSKKTRLFLVASLVLFFGISILTYSRGSMVFAIFFVGVYLLITRDWKPVKTFVVSLLLSLIVVYLPVNYGTSLILEKNLIDAELNPGGSLFDRLEQTFGEENIEKMQNNGRGYYLKKGFEIWDDHKLVGTGFATFGGAGAIAYGSPIYKDYGIDLSIYYKNKIYTDNQYIHILTETGLIGFTLFSVFLLALVAPLLKTWRDPFTAILIGLWVATGVAGVFYNIWELKVYNLIYFIILGTYANYRKWYR